MVIKNGNACLWRFVSDLGAWILGDSSLCFASFLFKSWRPDFSQISPKLDHPEGLKSGKFCARHCLLDFGAWILGDTSLCFASFFFGDGARPFGL